jgi:hypothetical protein
MLRNSLSVKSKRAVAAIRNPIAINRTGIDTYSETTPVRNEPSGSAHKATIPKNALTLPIISCGVFSIKYAWRGVVATGIKKPNSKQNKPAR